MKNKVLVMVVAFTLIGWASNLMAEERRGADLVVTKTDGQQITGELIAVKPSSLLLLDSQTGTDLSIEIGQIAVIKITKKSKALIVGAFGFGLGAIAGIIFVNNYVEGDPTTMDYAAGVGVFGPIVAIPCMLIAALVGKDKTIQIEGKADSEIKGILEELRHQARVTNAQ